MLLLLSQATNGTPEDRATLWEWMSFGWVTPLLRKAVANTALSPSDVYPLSSVMQARPLFIKFSRLRGGLLGRLWQANSRDLLVDFILTYVSIVLSYASPFFLKEIIDAFDVSQRSPEAAREARAVALLYALAAFSCSLLRAEVDLQHLYCGRRAAVRIRTELMASIYDKALKRKDISGSTGNRHGPNTNPEEKSGESTSNADSGKVLNLMSADATLVSNTVSAAHIVYGGKATFAGICQHIHDLKPSTVRDHYRHIIPLQVSHGVCLLNRQSLIPYIGFLDGPPWRASLSSSSPCLSTI